MQKTRLFSIHFTISFRRENAEKALNCKRADIPRSFSHFCKGRASNILRSQKLSEISHGDMTFGELLPERVWRNLCSSDTYGMAGPGAPYVPRLLRAAGCEPWHFPQRQPAESPAVEGCRTHRELDRVRLAAETGAHRPLVWGLSNGTASPAL